MFGLSGVISLKQKGEDSIKKLNNNLMGGLKSSLIKYKTFSLSNSLFTIYDEDFMGCDLEEKSLSCFVSGDFYDDLFEKSYLGKKAQYLSERYIKYGLQRCLDINGSYVFLIEDKDTNTYHIGTDENSFIPFYYTISGQNLYFSWDISRFLQLGEGNFEINYDNLFSGLLFGGCTFGKETRLKNIYQLEPGSAISFNEYGLNIIKTDPFSFQSNGNKNNENLESAASNITKAVEKRIKRHDKISLGFSAGLDSRILLSSGIKKYKEKFLTFTWGGINNYDRDIASLITKKYDIQHLPILLDDKMYIDYARDGVFYSAGSSLFKHGVQPHMFSTIKRSYNIKGHMEGPAMGILIGGELYPGAIKDLKNRSDLLDYYRKHFFALKQEQFTKLFIDSSRSIDFFEKTLNQIEDFLKIIPAENMVDLHAAFLFNTRIKFWYNHNLVNSLYSNRLLMPTYDHDFLKTISGIPTKNRIDGSFRIKLLTTINNEISNFPYDKWEQPAWLLPPYTSKFQKLVNQIEKAQYELWFSSGKTIYIPTNKHEANFLEWIRVYPEYQKFFKDILTSKDSILNQSFLNSNHISNLIESHIEGQEEYQKILILLLSSELSCQIFSKMDFSGVNSNFINFKEYFQ